jgi:hypothetical protein
MEPSNYLLGTQRAELKPERIGKQLRAFQDIKASEF